MRIVGLLLLCSAALAQAPPSTDAKAYVKYDQALIVLNHVRVIDGTGVIAADGELASDVGHLKVAAAAVDPRDPT